MELDNTGKGTGYLEESLSSGRSSSGSSNFGGLDYASIVQDKLLGQIYHDSWLCCQYHYVDSPFLNCQKLSVKNELLLILSLNVI